MENKNKIERDIMKGKEERERKIRKEIKEYKYMS
jgi:hypothetical protein